MPSAFCAATLCPSYSLQLSAVRWYCAHLAEVVHVGGARRSPPWSPGSRFMRSARRRTRRATCAECPRRSAREFSSRLTSTLRSSAARRACRTPSNGGRRERERRAPERALPPAPGRRRAARARGLRAAAMGGGARDPRSSRSMALEHGARLRLGPGGGGASKGASSSCRAMGFGHLGFLGRTGTGGGGAGRSTCDGSRWRMGGSGALRRRGGRACAPGLDLEAGEGVQIAGVAPRDERPSRCGPREDGLHLAAPEMRSMFRSVSLSFGSAVTTLSVPWPGRR